MLTVPGTVIYNPRITKSQLNTILVYEVKLDHIYPGNVRDPQQKAKAAHRQNNQLLPLKNVQKFLAKAVHDESHSHFHHGKLHSVHANIL